VAGADLIVLTEPRRTTGIVWAGKIRFASASNTSRQQDYSNKYNLDGVYTPQLVLRPVWVGGKRWTRGVLRYFRKRFEAEDSHRIFQGLPRWQSGHGAYRFAERAEISRALAPAITGDR